MTENREAVRLWVEVDLVDGVDPMTLADRLLDLFAEDPDDLFPEVDTVFDSGWGAAQ